MVLTDFPNELLAYVFLLGTLEWQENTPANLPFPILVSCVCQHWRILAHHTPQLWCSIFPPEFPELRRQTTFDWIHRWASRARDLPIAIVADGEAWCPPLSSTRANRSIKNLSSILESLAHHSERIYRLDIRCDLVYPSQEFIAGISNIPFLPHLRQLSLQVPRILPIELIYPSRFRGPWRCFANFPKLKTYRSDGMWIPVMKTLTTVSIRQSWLEVRSIKYLLSALPHLETLLLPSVRDIDDESSDSTRTDSSVYSADSLRVFAIGLQNGSLFNYEPHFRINILQEVQMPNLEYLEFHQTSLLSEVFPNGMQQDFQRLETVHFSNPSISENRDIDKVVLPTLSWLSTVRHLRFVSTRTDILTRLTPLHNPPTASPLHDDTDELDDLLPSIWPNLTSITYIGTVVSQDLVHICNFVKSHASMEILYLSSEARDCLSTWLVRCGDEVRVKSDLGASPDIQLDDVVMAHDVEELLEQMVRIQTIYRCKGLLDVEGFYLKELPVGVAQINSGLY